MSQHAFETDKKEAVYEAIFSRRDIRKEFLSKSIPKETLNKLLTAAHHAGSVGFMQPWNFIVIEDVEIREQVKTLFEHENQKASQNYKEEQKEVYQNLKLEGILETPLNLCVTCDPTRGGKHVLGRNTIKETDIFSTCCAIQNFWLAARAEGIGVGWVSILENNQLKEILNLPEHVIPVAYLCVGYVSNFPEKPMLEEAGWRNRLPLEELIYHNQWGKKPV